MKPHTRPGRTAYRRRQQAAQERASRPTTPEERLLLEIFGHPVPDSDRATQTPGGDQ